jgi:hypothetical protein
LAGANGKPAFPHLLECLLLPLIHFVLLSYLPLAGMRTLSAPGFAVGCGQVLKVRRDALKRLRTE